MEFFVSSLLFHGEKINRSGKFWTVAIPLEQTANWMSPLRFITDHITNIHNSSL